MPVFYLRFGLARIWTIDTRSDYEVERRQSEYKPGRTSSSHLDVHVVCHWMGQKATSVGEEVDIVEHTSMTWADNSGKLFAGQKRHER